MEERIRKTAFKPIFLQNKELSIENLTETLDYMNGEAPFNEEDFNFWKKAELPIRKMNPIIIVTKHIIDNFKLSNVNFKYNLSMNPKRILTNPEEGKFNEGRDNEENDLIVKVNDLITSPEKIEYIVLDLIGKGGSGQVFKCYRMTDKKEFAIKIIKNKKAYRCMAIRELKIIDYVNRETVNSDFNNNIIKKFDHFVFKGHVCIILELLSNNLFELVARNRYQGLRLNTINYILKQILDAILRIHSLNLIHCDLKPENILLNLDPEKSIVFKITDFGSASLKNSSVPLYVQSRHYRAPEVLIGSSYSQEIDMWSVGCIAAELFLGTLFFPGSCEYDMLYRINTIIGEFPPSLVHNCKKRDKFFFFDGETYKLKSSINYYRENPNEKLVKNPDGPNIRCIDDMRLFNRNIIKSPQYDNKLNAFIHFLKSLLCIDPRNRMDVKTALRHPFITNEKFSEQSFYKIKDQFNNQNEFTISPENHKFYNSMIVGSTNKMNYSYHTANDVSSFRPNVNNIPLKALKHFPYMMIPNNINFNDNIIYQELNHSNSSFNYNHHNTYMQTSFDQLNSSYNPTKFNNKSPIKRRNYNIIENNNANLIFDNQPNQSNYLNMQFTPINILKYDNQHHKSEGNESTFYNIKDNNSLNLSKGIDSFSALDRKERNRSNSDAFYSPLNNNILSNNKYNNISTTSSNNSNFAFHGNFLVTDSKNEMKNVTQQKFSKFKENKNYISNNFSQIDRALVFDDDDENYA